MFKANTRFLIWGIGKTGRSIIDFLCKKYSNNILTVACKTLPDDVIVLKKKYSISFVNDKNIIKELENYDVLIPSPGIKIPKEIQQKNKIVTELDIFYHHWGKKIIAITGSVGKTSITSLLYQTLSRFHDVCIGGNIGIPVLDLLKSNATIAIIEVSSAQLQYTNFFTPHYAIWTNFFPNHLDYHSSIEEYFVAKTKIFSNQKEKLNKLYIHQHVFDLLHNHEISISKEKITFIDANNIKKNIPDISYPENWLFIDALVNDLGIHCEFEKIHYALPEHRLELLPIQKKLIFNDSKATIMASVQHAVTTLKDRYRDKNITLIIGGLSKGADRTNDLLLIKNSVTHIICFGKESNELGEKIHTPYIYNTLEDAISCALSITHPDDIILFSPGGSSFDLFSSYEHRGDEFKNIILKNISLI